MTNSCHGINLDQTIVSSKSILKYLVTNREKLLQLNKLITGFQVFSIKGLKQGPYYILRILLSLLYPNMERLLWLNKWLYVTIFLLNKELIKGLLREWWLNDEIIYNFSENLFELFNGKLFLFDRLIYILENLF